ncbi:mirror-image polydactyly gene 1 protein isoform X1 [Rana temporaria]|uniref:mirror-image polydactyly gene 1 protein isoform X1 n=1 Tax=Rana temporaria TaxID=8407 RepID=UPI001AAC78EB|nr:mirror-image polydactyly gene 1 protein isoform X1 [Rana temporaria]XP_040189023.1 mirror-image polydactyly gene 1 protein isoform X1 [Rana temporaria]XP_040189024.1 mirror-image polydactyly gene 1 protein isoform X1 [Rana temporaria]
MASSSSQELRRSKGVDGENVPVPSPRNLSANRLLSVEKSDVQQSSDRPDLQPASSTQEWGKQDMPLLQELDYLRHTNKKLQETLMRREKDLDTLKLDAELLEQATQARIAEKTAALVEEVYRAQRERDDAIMARLRLANEERDEALLRVQQLQLVLQQVEDVNPEEGDMTLQELLGRLGEAEGGTAIHQNGELILERIRKSRERREQITAEEMGAVIQDRDAARGQCKHLEKELHLLRESKQICTDIVTTQRTFDPASKVPLSFLQHDENKVVEDYKRLEEELQNLRVYYSLHQSLSQEVNLKEQFSQAMTLYDEALQNREELLSINQKQNQELGLQLREMQTQNVELQESLRRASSTQQEMEERGHKLERLVDVLRKKVGAGNVRTVL